MELKEAKKYAEDVQIHLLQHTSATDYPPTKKDDALICLANRITELEAEMKQILNEFDAVEAQRDELVKAGTARINALDDLLACYRLGKQQSEKLFNRLLESGMAWEKAKGE